MKKLKNSRTKANNVFLLLCQIFVFGVVTAVAQPEGAINALFSVNGNGKRVYFSQGNLQYMGSAEMPYWKFADHQWDYFGSTTGQNSSNHYVDRDLFPWGTSGYNHGAGEYQPWSISTTDSYFYAYGSFSNDLNDQTGQADWGYNAIVNGGNTEGMWRTLTRDEWAYVFNTRYTWSGIRFAKAKVNDVKGVILLPDDWNESYYSLNKPNQKAASHASNVITASQWETLEQHGAIFLPAAGYRHNVTVYEAGEYGGYWSSTHYEGENTMYDNSEDAYDLYFYGTLFVPTNGTRHYGQSVRLVIQGPDGFYTINASPNPEEGGTVEGAGNQYPLGSECVLTATANEGFVFESWTEDGEVVSEEPTYSFIVVGDRELVANFIPEPPLEGVVITLQPGWNWISYLLEEEVAVEEALVNLVPADGDIIKSEAWSSIYYSSNGVWEGSLRTMVPGEGYMYYRNGPLVRFTYPKN